MTGSEYLGKSSLGHHRSDESLDSPASVFSDHSALCVLCAFVVNLQGFCIEDTLAKVHAAISNSFVQIVVDLHNRPSLAIMLAIPFERGPHEQSTRHF